MGALIGKTTEERSKLDLNFFREYIFKLFCIKRKSGLEKKEIVLLETLIKW